MADWAGKTLGKVHIHELIARGGMAEVYTGTHDTVGQVAVKVMRGLLDKDSEQLARFQREAEVVEELHHTNIVQMYDYDVLDESPYLVMEYIPGPSLAAYLKSLHDKKQRMPIGMVAHILNSIASALDYAHEKGMVHRDIKPANVLLRSHDGLIELNKPLPQDVEPVLTDFGLVRLLDSTMHTTAGSVSGTPTYMSPEQARGEKVDKRTDIYSLGIMLYEMLAGVVPFQADTTFGMLMKHINEPPAQIAGLSEGLQAILDRTLAKDPSLRYDSAGELAREFTAIFNGQTVSPGTLHIAQIARQVSDAGKQTPARQEEKRYTRWLRIAIEIFVAAMLAFVILQFFQPEAPTVVATAVPPNPNSPVGRVRFDDFNFFMDSAAITLTKVNQPEAGKHLEAWFISDDKQKTRDIGRLEFGPTGAGRVQINDPQALNFLHDFNQVVITVEEDNVQIDKPTGKVLYSSIMPPQSLEHIRNVLVSYDPLPDHGPLMQNLWYYSADYINRSINGDEFDQNYKAGIAQAYQNNDEPLLRHRTEEVINLIVGNQSNQYLDYDKDGIEDDPGDGYGALPNGNRLGYYQETALHAKNATDASDSTPNIRLYGGNVQICVQNLNGWTDQILQLALQLNETPFGPKMEPIINQLSTLGNNLMAGVDVNNNGRLNEALAGECGADAAYENAYFMADMLLYPGPDRIPPPEK